MPCGTGVISHPLNDQWRHAFAATSNRPGPDCKRAQAIELGRQDTRIHSAQPSRWDVNAVTATTAPPRPSSMRRESIGDVAVRPIAARAIHSDCGQLC